MKNTAEWALANPHVVWLATIMALCYGALSYVDLPRQENPTLPDRHAAITTYVPGAEPEKIELLVTKVLEDRVAEVDDIDSIFSESVEGTSYIQVELVKGAPYAQRLAEIRRKVQEARPELPVNALEPEVNTEVLRTNTMILAVSGDVGPIALREQAKLVKRRLEYLASVRKVELLGEADEEILVSIDSGKLAERNLPLARVVDAIEQRNSLAPGGLLELANMRSAIQTSGSYDHVHQIGSTYLGAGESGQPIALSDVSAIERRLAERKVFVRWNGTESVSVELEMLPGRNAIALGERVRTLIEELQPELLDGVEIGIIADEPRYVGDRLSTLTSSLNLGLILVLALSLIGLGWRSGFIIAVSIPLSITVAIGFIGMFDIALHQISIAALVIALGLVVDEDIVVVDNIQRHIDQGKDPNRAAIDGLGEIHRAVLSGAGTTIAAFIPLALMSGDIGEFVRSIPIAVSLMLVSSVIIAHYFTPLLSATLHRIGAGVGARRRREEHPFEPRYRRTLAYLMQHPAAVILGFAALFLASTWGVGRSLIPPDFFNDADRHQFLVEIWLGPGTPVSETNVAAARVEEILAQDERIESWGAYVGAGVPKFYYNQFTERVSESVGMFVVNTTSEVPFDETRTVAEELDRKLEAMLPGVWVRSKVLKQGYGGGDAVRIFVQGESIDILRELAGRVKEIVEQVEGTKDVREFFGYDPLTLKAEIDFAKANVLGISNRDVATTLRTALDGVTASTFREGDEEIAIRVRLDASQRRDVDDLDDLLLFSPVTGTNVPFSQVASIEPGFATRAILRWRRKREAGVSSGVTGDRTLMAVAEDVEKAVLARVTVPAGYEISFHGQRKEVVESFTSLARAGVIAIFLIYILLVVQFRSLSRPALVILAIPMALVGAIWGLVITDQPLGFMAFLGMISLIGIVVNDSIVLLDYINTLRRRGSNLEEAVLFGASTRLRAITLTSLTTIGGLLPLSLAGGTLFAPFGWAMIFGMLGSTVLTLVVQPIAYLSLERWRLRRGHGEESSAMVAEGAA